jgi:hypothetical protein
MMDKFDKIEALYARRSELNLNTCTLENEIAKSSSSPNIIQMMKDLRDIHYEEFMLEYEIKAVLQPDIKSIWNRIINR